MGLFKHSFRVAKLLNRFGITQSWKGVRFLCYHNIFKDTDVIPNSLKPYSIHKNEFCEHLYLFKRLGINVISMDKALNILKQNEINNERHVCITFDDGYMDNFKVAWPILKKLRFGAHFFICSGFMGNNSNPSTYMGVNEIKSLVAEGGTIGSHSQNHPILTSQKYEDVVTQVTASKKMLEDIIKEDIDSFAYPNSQYNKTIIDIIRSAGYRYSFIIGLGCVKKISAYNQYIIPRNVIHGGRKAENTLMIRGGYDWACFYSKVQAAYKKNISLIDSY